MVDIHTHIIYDIDDGSRNFEDSKSLILEAINAGFKYLVLTPHYIEDSIYKANNFAKKVKFLELKKWVKEEQLNIQLFLGNEIFVNANILELIKEEEVMPLNVTKYILIELPRFSEVNNLREIIFDLRIAGYRPIIAHPERCEVLQNDLSFVKELKTQGALFQANAGSILGMYGNKAKNTLKTMLKNDYIDILSSDAHHPKDIYLKYDQILKKLKKIIGQKKLTTLTTDNPLKVIKNEEIE